MKRHHSSGGGQTPRFLHFSTRTTPRWHSVRFSGSDESTGNLDCLAIMQSFPSVTICNGSATQFDNCTLASERKYPQNVVNMVCGRPHTTHQRPNHVELHTLECPRQVDHRCRSSSNSLPPSPGGLPTRWAPLRSHFPTYYMRTASPAENWRRQPLHEHHQERSGSLVTFSGVEKKTMCACSGNTTAHSKLHHLCAKTY